MRVACIGEAMIELSLPSVDATHAGIGIAGDTLNTAIYLKRAAPALDVAYVTVVGTDALSERMVSFIQSEDLQTTLIGRHEKRAPGLYAITTDEDGERSFTYWRSASAARTLFGTAGPKLGDLADFDLIYLSAITLAILPADVRASLHDWLQGFRRNGGTVAFDSNYRPALWEDTKTAQNTVAAYWRLTDLALPSVDDEMNLFADKNEATALSRLQSHGLSAGALKRGAEGPLCLAGTPAQDYPPAKSVVDSTAAGDSFNGGYLAAWSKGLDPAAC